MNNNVERIAKRHIARCLSAIDEVHYMPDVCRDTIKKEMHFCAEDVAAMNDKVSNNGNQPKPHTDI